MPPPGSSTEGAGEDVTGESSVDYFACVIPTVVSAGSTFNRGVSAVSIESPSDGISVVGFTAVGSSALGGAGSSASRCINVDSW